MKLLLAAFSALSIVHASTTGISPRSEDSSNLAQAVRHWQSRQECHPAYFTRTNTTLALSNQASYYQKWHESLHTNNPEDSRKSAYNLFSREHWGGLDFDCKAQFNAGCHVIPDCTTIVRATMERENNNGKSLEEALEKARTVYFVMQSFVYVNWDMHGRAESFKAVEHSVMLSIDGLVKSFAQQVDAKADFLCDVALKTFDIVLGALGRLCAFDVEHGKDAVKMVGWTKSMVKTMKSVNGMAVQGNKINHPKSHGAVNQEFEVHLTPQYAEDWCSIFGGGGRKDSNDKHTHGLRVHLDKVFKDFRGSIYETSEIMGFSTKYDDWIQTDLFEDTSKVMNSKKIAFEDNAVKKIQEWAMSAIFNGAQCYQKCHTGLHSSEDCMGKSVAQSRFCAQVNDSTSDLCQLSCWTTIGGGGMNWMTRNHEIELYGIKNLEKYGYTIDGIQKGSYENYLRHGNERSHKSLSKSIDAGPDSGKTALNLNVCRSTRTQVFPCSCGDWRSNETSSFMDKMGFSESGKDRMKLAEGLFNYVCPKQFVQQALSPAESFLAFCAISTRFPSKFEGNKFVAGEKNPYCSIANERMAKMTVYEGNRYFCDWFWYENPVFLTEKNSFIWQGLAWRSHRLQCNAWTKKNPRKYDSRAVLEVVKTPGRFFGEGAKKADIWYNGKTGGVSA